VTDTIQKRLSWELEVDLNDFKRDLGSVTSAINQLTQDLRSMLMPALSGVGKSGQKGMGDTAQAAQRLKAEAKAVAAEVAALGKQAEAAFKGATRDVAALEKAIRQVDMSPWQKQADTYADRIKVAQSQVAQLKQRLQDVTLTEAQRAKITETIEKAQAQIVRLQQAQAKVSALAVAAAEKQKQAEQERVAVAVRLRQEREAAAKAADQERQAVAAARAAERSLATGKRERERNASALNSDAGRLDSSLKGQIDSVSAAMRQSGMFEWQKLADNYGVAIAKASAHVDVLRGKLQAASLTEKDRVALMEKIAQGERHIADLTEKSRQRVLQVKAAEEARLHAVQANAIARAKQQQVETAQELAGTGRTLAAGTFLALSMGIGAASKSMMDLSDQTTAFRAQANATEADVRKLVDTAQDLEGIGTTAAATAAAALGRAGLEAQEVTAHLGKLSKAAVDVNEQMDRVSKVSLAVNRAFGLTTEQLDNTIDILVATANASDASISEIGVGFQQLASKAAQANQTLEDTAKLYATLIDAGLSPSVAGEAAESMLTRMIVMTKEGKKGFAELGTSIVAANGEIRPVLTTLAEMKKAMEGMSREKQINLAEKIFGETGGNAFATYLTQTEEKLKKTSKAIDDHNKITERTFEIMRQSEGFGFRELLNDLEDLRIEFAESILPTLRLIIGTGKEAVQLFNDLPGPIKAVIGNLALLAVGASAVFLGAGGIVFLAGQGVKALDLLNEVLDGKVVKGMMAAQRAGGTWGAGLMKLVTGPIGAFIGAAALIYQAYKTNFAGIGDIIDEMLGSFSGLTDGLDQAMSQMGQFFKGIQQLAVETLITFVGFTDDVFGGLFKTFGSFTRMLRAVWERDWNWFKSEFENTANNFKSVADTVFNSLGDQEKMDRIRERAYNKYFKPIQGPKEAPGSGDRSKPDPGPGGGTGSSNQLDVIMAALNAELSRLSTAQTRLETEKLTTEEMRLQTQESERHVHSEEELMRLVYPNMARMGRGAHSHGYEARDVPVAAGSPVFAAQGGTVIQSGWKGNYGKTVMIDHGNGLVTLYAHNSSLAKKVGDVVRQGEQIALSGSTGRSTGPHGHFEIRERGGKPISIAANMQRLVGNGFSHPDDADMSAHERETGLIKQKAAAIHKAILLVEAYRSKLKAGSEDELKAADALRGLREREAEAGRELAQHHLDWTKERIQAEKEVQAEIQKSIQSLMDFYKSAFDAYVSGAKQAADAGRDQFNQLKESIRQAGLLPEEAEVDPVFGDMQAREQQIRDLTKQATEYRDAIALLRSMSKDMSAEQAQQLAEMEKGLKDIEGSQRRLVFQYERLYGSKPTQWGNQSVASDHLSMEAVALAGKDSDQYLANLDEANDKGRAFIDGLLANGDAMRDFIIQVNGGAASVEELGKKYGLTDRQLGKLTKGMQEYIRTRDILEGKAGDKSVSNAADPLALLFMDRRPDAAAIGKPSKGGSSKKASQDYAEVKPSDILKDMFSKENLAQVADAGVGVFRMIGDAIAEFDRDAAESFHNLVSVAGGAFGAIGRILSGDFIGGAIQGFLNVFSTVIGMITTTQRLIRETREEAERAKAIADAAELDDLDRQIRAAKANGKSTYQLEVDRAIKGAEKDITDAIYDFNRNLGRQGVTWGPNGLTLNLDGIPLEKQAKVKNDFAELARTVNQHTGQMSDDIKAAQKAFVEILPGIFGALGTDPQERAQRELDKIQNRLAYQKRNYDEPAKRDALKKDFLARLGLDPSNVDFAEVGDQYAEAVRDIQTEIEEEFHGRHINWLQPPEDVQAEFQRRLAKLWPEFHRQIQAAVDKASDTAKQQLNKNLQDAENLLRQRAEAMAEAQQEMFEEDSAHTNRQIALHERLLAKIEAQNERLRKQIDLKRELLAQDEAKFEREDQGLYAKAVAGVDFDAELRAGLKAIHNPDGVLTETYSGQSHIEAMKERAALLKLSAENKFNLEQFDSTDPAKNKALFLDEMKRIAAIEGRFAAEQLKTAEEGSRAYLELQQMQAQAYTSFKEAHLEAMRDATEKEVAYIETQIAANDKKAAKVQQNLEAYRSDLARLTEERDRDLKEIDKSVKALTEAHNPWKVAVTELRNGIKRPLADITSWYRGLVHQLKEAAALGVKTTGNLAYTLGVEGKSLNVAQAEAYAQNMVSKMLGSTGLPRMAGGGVVPAGFDGDRFPALLNSGEPVFPKWFAELIEGAWRMNHGGTSSVYNQQRAYEINIPIYDAKNPEQVRRMVLETLRQAGIDPNLAKVNGTFMGSLN